MAPNALETAALSDATHAFLHRPSTSLLARAQLAAITDDIPMYDTTENYSRDVERRIQVIRQIQKRVRTASPPLVFNTMQVAYLLQLDYTQLVELNRDEEVGFLFHTLGSIQPFVHACEPIYFFHLFCILTGLV